MKPTDLRRYKAALTNLVEHRNPPRHAVRVLSREAGKVGGDPATPVAVLGRDHIQSVLGAVITGEMSGAELCAWAGAVLDRLAYLHTGGKPLSAEIGYQAAVYNAVKLLAATAARDLNAAVMGRVIALLDCADLDPGREWSEEETARYGAMMEMAHQGMIGQVKQGLAAALLEADIRGISDPELIPIMLSRGVPQPGQHSNCPLGEDEDDLAGFELCGVTWMIRPGPARDLADLSRVSLGRTRSAALIAHDHGEFRDLIALARTEPVPAAVARALPWILATARVSGLRL
jgi:hypothetical protein